MIASVFKITITPSAQWFSWVWEDSVWYCKKRKNLNIPTKRTNSKTKDGIKQIDASRNTYVNGDKSNKLYSVESLRWNKLFHSALNKQKIHKNIDTWQN